MSFLGESLSAAVFLLCSFAAVFGLVVLILQNHTAKQLYVHARRAFFLAALVCIAQLLLLIVAFITDDFSLAAVGRYSSVELPLIYKLSAVWAGSAGSLVLWSAGVFILFSLWLVRSKTGNLVFEAAALTIGSAVCLGFTALLVFVEKPFASCPVTIDDGAGLNPLLQNFWMIVHPPLLFIGYSAFLVPFVVVLASVFSGWTEKADFYRQLRGWLLFGICFLGLGIATGAKWSYIELGWGGFWAWDPVENASLLPWLAAVAALHSLVAIKLADKFKLGTIVLAPMPFILSLVATFITRSGILASVHSFDKSIIFAALLAFIVCVSLLWAICIIRAVKNVPVNPSEMSIFSLDKGEILFWAIIIFILMAIAIGTATLWPIISRAITNSHSAVIPTRLFYDRMISVTGIILAFLIGLAGLSELQKHSGFLIKLLICCGTGVVCFGLVVKLSGPTLLMSLAWGICAFSFAAVLMKLQFSLKVKGRIGGEIAHLGLLLLVVAAGFSSLEQSVQTHLARGEKLKLGDYALVYDTFEHKPSADVTMIGPEIVLRKKNITKRLWPHNNLYPDGQQTSEVAVYTGLLEDIYILFDDIDLDGKVVMEVKLKPLMLWVWCAALLIVIGPAVAIIEGKRTGK